MSHPLSFCGGRIKDLNDEDQNDEDQNDEDQNDEDQNDEVIKLRNEINDLKDKMVQILTDNQKMKKDIEIAFKYLNIPSSKKVAGANLVSTKQTIHDESGSTHTEFGVEAGDFSAETEQQLEERKSTDGENTSFRDKTIFQSWRKGVSDVESSSSRKLLYNTKTIHLYAITTVYSGKKYAWIWIIISLVLVIAQILTLSSIVMETSFPTCDKNESCHSRGYCDENTYNFGTPRCQDCLGFIFDYVDMTCNLKQEDSWECSAVEHCEEIFEAADPDMKNMKVCPKLKKIVENLSWGQYVVFIFVVFLFASDISKEVEEGTIDERIFEYVIKTKGSSAPLSFANFIQNAHRIVLRIRRYFIPILTSAAAISVLLSSSLSAQDIILDAISVIIVTEADNMAATLLLNPSKLILLDEIVQDVKKDESFVYMPLFLRTRTVGIVSAAIIFIMAIYMNQILLFHTKFNGACSNIVPLIFLYVCGIFPLLFLINHTAWTFKYCGSKVGLMDLSRSQAAYAVSFFLFRLGSADIAKYYPLGIFFWVSLAVLIMCILTMMWFGSRHESSPNRHQKKSNKVHILVCILLFTPMVTLLITMAVSTEMFYGDSYRELQDYKSISI